MKFGEDERDTELVCRIDRKKVTNFCDASELKVENVCTQENVAFCAQLISLLR